MAIQINKVSSRDVMNWISRGWHLFKEQSGLWMASIFVIFGGAVITASIHPVLGAMFGFLSPFLMAGFYHMAHKADNGLTSKLNELFVAFENGRVRLVFIRLAALQLIVFILASPLEAQVSQAITSGTLVDPQTAFLLTVVKLLMSMLFIFAVPVVWFYHEQNPFKAMHLSFMACVKNIGPLILFGLIAFGLVVLTVPTLFLAMIIVQPWLNLAGYLAFNDIIQSDIPLEEDKNKDNEVTILV